MPRVRKGPEAMKPKLSPSVSTVWLGDGIIEFFKTNTRRHLRIKSEDDSMLDLVNSLDGTRTTEEIAREFGVSEESLAKLLSFMEKNGVLDNLEPTVDFDGYSRFRRAICFLQDYSTSHEHLVSMWNKLRGSTVLVIGLGAVGTWVACNLVQSGVASLIIMDPDVVELSNLHRQFGYVEADIGRSKVDALADALKRYSPDVDIRCVGEGMADDSLSQFDDRTIDLIVNCADYPNVDATSLWVGEYGMRRGIPHIIGGGYNMHLSLIGQTVIPGETACVKCFDAQLREENRIDPKRVKKLHVRNRKMGSFGPLCALNASMVGMEAIKVLTGCAPPANANRRGEFDIMTMDVKYRSFERRDDCEWCGKDGIYRGDWSSRA